MKIYVASSWRNKQQPELIQRLRKFFDDDDIYDFRNPGPGKAGFKWESINPDWRAWTAEDYIEALQHAAAKTGYQQDMDAMKAADICVLLLPAGRSAHLEAGWMKGAGKKLVICTRNGEEPELMAKMADAVVEWWDLPMTLIEIAEQIDPSGGSARGYDEMLDV